MLERLWNALKTLGTSREEHAAVPLKLNVSELEIAVRRDDVGAVKALLANGANPSQHDTSGVPMLARSLRCSNNVVFRTLLAAGADVNGSDPDGDTVLHSAIQRKNLEAVRLLVEAGADVNQTGYVYSHLSPLMEAAYRGDEEISGLLIRAGANINFVSSRMFGTPLMAAVLNQKAELASLLIKHGADPNLGQPTWSNPLTLAAAAADEASIQTLIDAGADVNGSAGSGTPLTAAAFSGHIQIVKKLLTLGADPNRSDLFGETPLGALADPSGNSPYMGQGPMPDDVRLQAALVLLDAGADPLLPSPPGTSAVVRAERAGNHRMVNLFNTHKDGSQIGDSHDE